MHAVILAGGLGARLKPFTEVIPKSLLPIGESSVLEIQILSLKNHGIKDIIIATNYMSEYVEAFLGDGSTYGVSLAWSTSSSTRETGILFSDFSRSKHMTWMRSSKNLAAGAITFISLSVLSPLWRQQLYMVS